ncbi:hypothetical protein BT93_D2127 [Corymbia citriodora subsp. variegata]|nr:hypothetical protein BT93_D2127 [Corymbia citriodora subsp. variegata]
MRPAPELSATALLAPQTALHLLPPHPSPAAATLCSSPPADGANAAMILIVLLCGLICALALNTAIRCFLRRRRRRGRGDARPPVAHQPRSQQEQPEPKLGDFDLIAAPAATYAPGVTKLAGTEAECAICLTEFVEGNGIRVLATCSHGFHEECIERWLRSRKSCPTCRSS